VVDRITQRAPRGEISLKAAFSEKTSPYPLPKDQGKKTGNMIMAKKKVFVSFDYDHDKYYKYLIEAWESHPGFVFVFKDAPPQDVNHENIDRIKSALTKKINAAAYTLVIVGKAANQMHPDHELIGCKNWIDFEVRQSKINHNKLVGVKLNQSYDSPDELLNTPAKWVFSFDQNQILFALDKV
jgi:hypothetical protein